MSTRLVQADQLVKINGQAINQVVYKNQPVITLRMMDEVHDRNEGTARNAFFRNKEHLVENEDFFVVPYEEWSKTAVKNINGGQDTGQRNPMIFLTQTGYLLLVKSFTDKKAWQVQKELAKVYFQIKKPKTNIDPLDVKLKRLRELDQIKSITPKERQRLRVEILGDTADAEPFELAVSHQNFPLLQLLELLIHVSKSGRRFNGVDVILTDAPVIQFSNRALMDALNQIAKENNIQPFKSCSHLIAAIRKPEILNLANWTYEGQVKRTSERRVFRLIKLRQ